MIGKAPISFMWCILLTLIMWGVACAGEWHGTTVYICDDGAEWPPYTYYQRVDGQVTDTIVGFSVDVIDRIFKNEGVPYHLDLLPWKRCMAEVAEGKRYHMFLSGGRNPERERTYHISEPYYRMHPGYLYSGRKHPSGLAIRGREDLKKFRVCGILGYNYIVFGLAEDQIDTGTGNYESLVKKLLTGRCDLSIDRLEILLGFKAIGKDFIKQPDLVFRAIPDEPAEPFHMMFTKNEFGSRLKRVVDEGMRDLQASGELETLMGNYDLILSAGSPAGRQSTNNLAE
jgi:polar amino acid transport system substrate-binding protein